jgi:hypothetical protein
MMFTAREKATEARREEGYRRRVYARLVGEGKMKGHDADQRIALMQEIAEDYAALAEAEEKKQRLL